MLGACWSRKVASRKLHSLRTCPRIFDKVVELTRCSTITTTQRSKTKRGFTPFCKGLGIYCNGFWGCGFLGPHKCNLSDLSHYIKEVEIVKERTSIHCIIDAFMLRLLSCISYRKVHWSRERERERSSYFVCRGFEEKRKERDREKETVRSA